MDIRSRHIAGWMPKKGKNSPPPPMKRLNDSKQLKEAGETGISLEVKAIGERV
jgi:hypothetical protein